MGVWLILEDSYPGSHTYRVMVNGDKHDRFTSRKKLRRDDMRDIAAGYKEALDNYQSAMVESVSDERSSHDVDTHHSEL